MRYPGLTVGWIFLLLAPAVAFGNRTDASIERTVEPGGPGGNRLEVDVELLAGAAKGLHDLRLFAANGDEVPYLLLEQPRGERRWVDGRILPVSHTRWSSGFEVDLGEIAMVDRIRIEGLPAPFLKRLRLEGGGDRSRWTVLHGEATLFDLPDEGLSLLELDFDPGEYRYLRVTWDDRSSARLPAPRRVGARLFSGPQPPPPLVAELGFEKIASEPGRSRYRVFLPAPGLPIVGIELEVADSRVLRQARVSEARLTGSEIRPHSLGETTLRRVVLDELVASQMEVAISPPAEDEVEIEIDDGDNPPLDLQKITARFAPQPWIYFESADGGELTARYGAPGLRAPRYDLEALRQELGSDALASDVQLAKFGPGRQLMVTASPEELSIADAVGGGAKIGLDGFQTRRGVEPGPLGLNAVRLDPAVLAGSRNLGDLRIVDGSAAQVPYILEQLGEPTIVDLEGPVAMPGKNGEQQSVYGLTLPFANLPAAVLTIDTTAGVFERRVRLVREERRNPRDPPVPVTLDEQIWRNVDAGRGAPPLSLHVPAHVGLDLMLIVDEGDNSALQIGNPRLYLPTYRLRFIRRDEDALWLMYGREGLAAPRYDLALLAPRVLGARVPEVGLSEVTEALPTATGAGIGIFVFWGALILVLAVLLGLVARLLRRG
jgi:hypothetical protein